MSTYRTKQSGIYAIENTVTGERYYGSTVCKDMRFASHRRGLKRGSHENPHLQNAWNKYGADAFVFLWIEDVDADRLDAVENEYLSANAGKGYNIAVCAESNNRGRKLGPASEERKRKISEALKGRKHTPEAIAKMVAAKQSLSPDTIARMSAAQKARGEEIRAFHTGRKHTDEARKKMSDALTGKPLTESHKAAISRGLMGNSHTKGKRLSDEHKAKVSASQKGRAWSEEHRRKAVEGIRLAHAKKKQEQQNLQAA